jgi:hypothetical protein
MLSSFKSAKNSGNYTTPYSSVTAPFRQSASSHVIPLCKQDTWLLPCGFRPSTDLT